MTSSCTLSHVKQKTVSQKMFWDVSFMPLEHVQKLKFMPCNFPPLLAVSLSQVNHIIHRFPDINLTIDYFYMNHDILTTNPMVWRRLPRQEADMEKKLQGMDWEAWKLERNPGWSIYTTPIHPVANSYNSKSKLMEYRCWIIESNRDTCLKCSYWPCIYT